MIERMLMLVIIVAFLLSCADNGANDDQGKTLRSATTLDSILLQAVESGKISGAVVQVTKEGHKDYQKAFGYSNLENGESLKSTDIFRIASMTKAVTAVAAMILYEQGKFELDDSLASYIPEFANPGILESINARDTTFTTHPAKGYITIRQLFTHSSGSAYGYDDENLMPVYMKAGITEGFEERDILLADNVLRIAKMPIMHEPGERFTYGLNSDILGRLVEIWSGKSLDIFMSEEIFKPLGMNDTYFYLPEDKADRLVDVYMSSQNGVIPTDYPLIHYPVKGAKRYLSGGADLSSTASDYSRFCQMLLNGGTLENATILQPATVDLMTQTHLETGDEDMGLGFSYTSEQPDRRLKRKGSFSGGGFFSTAFWIDPAEQLTAVIMLQMYPFNDWDLITNLEVAIYNSYND